MERTAPERTVVALSPPAGGSSPLDLEELEKLLSDSSLPAPDNVEPRGAPREPAADPGLGLGAGSARKSPRRTRGGLPPAWLVDVSGVDWVAIRDAGALVHAPAARKTQQTPAGGQRGRSRRTLPARCGRAVRTRVEGRRRESMAAASDPRGEITQES